MQDPCTSCTSLHHVVLLSGVATRGSGGSMNGGPRAPGGPRARRSTSKISKNRRKTTKIWPKWAQNAQKSLSAPDPTGGAYDAPPDTLVGWGGGKLQTPPPQKQCEVTVHAEVFNSRRDRLRTQKTSKLLAAGNPTGELTLLPNCRPS